MSVSDIITIDGSAGEGGGQILRTCLALSMVTGRPFRIEKIRAGRQKPGLMRQHLAAVNAATRITAGAVEGHFLGSAALTFRPKAVQPGRYHFSIGSAGNCTLVLQAVLPALLLAKAPSQLVLEGGTHNPFAPPFDFLEQCLFKVIGEMGPKIKTTLQRPGFYPAGGGRMTVAVQPTQRLFAIEKLERGAIRRHTARALVANLPLSIARRELGVLGDRLGWDKAGLKAVAIDNARGPGNILMAEIEAETITELFTGFGRRGVPAEAVAEGVAGEVADYLKSPAPVGRHLADQLLIPMALAGGGRFRTLPPSPHTLTNMEVIKSFLPVTFAVAERDTNLWEIAIGS
jgi:RNA 3'-terminal phosphate cyclase (ATP)